MSFQQKMNSLIPTILMGIKMIIFNITEKPIKENHISYFVKRHFNEGREHITLYEMKEYVYTHPMSEGNSTVSKIDYEIVCSFGIYELLASPLLLLENALNTIKLMKDKLMKEE